MTASAEVVEPPPATAAEEPDWLRKAADELGWTWARVAWQRAAAVPGAWYDAAKADAVVALWPRFFRLTEDRFAGRPFQLNAWQAVIVRLLVGWKVPTPITDDQTGETTTAQVRLFRQLRLWVPRKNGKSEFLAALSLLFWALEGVVGGQGFCFARDVDQGKIPFSKMKVMVGYHPELAANIKVFNKALWIPQIRASFALLSGKPEGKHGRSPTVILGDEMHEWATTELSTTLRQGTGARLQPIELYASTAGLKSNATGYGLWEESLAILEGRVQDPTTLVVIFAADPEADFAEEAVWRGANPSLGLSPTLAFLQREVALAKLSPRAEAHFRRFHLNQWVESAVRWLSLKAWDACAEDKDAWQSRRDSLLGRSCFGALDVSSTKDITAWVLLFPPEDGGRRYKLLCRFWVPEETIKVRAERDRVSYDQWEKLGAIVATPGDYVDQAFVQQAIEEDLGAFDIERIGFDPWNARKLYGDLVAEGADPELFLEMRQGTGTLGEPSKFFERLVSAGRLDHGGHPVLRWMAGHCEVRFDENMNFVPAKKRSRDKIDGIVAAVMACGLAMTPEESNGLDAMLANPVMAGVR